MMNMIGYFPDQEVTLCAELEIARHLLGLMARASCRKSIFFVGLVD
jgi:hypothetical protein